MFSIMVALMLLVVAVVVIFITNALKAVKFLQNSLWSIPSACIVAIALLVIFQALTEHALTLGGLISNVIVGALVGFASGGLYRLGQLLWKRLP